MLLARLARSNSGILYFVSLFPVPFTFVSCCLGGISKRLHNSSTAKLIRFCVSSRSVPFSSLSSFLPLRDIRNSVLELSLKWKMILLVCVSSLFPFNFQEGSMLSSLLAHLCSLDLCLWRAQFLQATLFRTAGMHFSLLSLCCSYSAFSCLPSVQARETDRTSVHLHLFPIWGHRDKGERD